MKKMVDAIVEQESGSKYGVVGVRKRRTYSRLFKAEVAAQCLMPGASVSAIALSHGINANVIRKWLPLWPVPLSRAPVFLGAAASLLSLLATQPLAAMCFLLPRSTPTTSRSAYCAYSDEIRQ